MQRDDLLDYLHKLLAVDQFQDYAPNGLQVEGKADIHRIVLGVTASQALIDAAIEYQADAIIVHHGYFWKSEPLTITGMKYRRIRRLIQQDMNLLAYHLPLDAHPQLGNNAQLAQLWGLDDITPTDADAGRQPSLIRLGRLSAPISIEDFKLRIEQTLQRSPLHLPGGPQQIETVAWCSGGAQGYIQQAIDWHADVYISGEVSEQTCHQAAENGLHYLAAGHHATETWGVKALTTHLNDTLGLETHFIDCPNPV